MIFVAVGTQFSFDRLVRYMDEWAGLNNEEVIAQIGEGNYSPKHIKYERFMDSDEYNKNIREASVFVSHAGMGNIISAKDLHTPIIVMNRQFKLGEHRNDHQADGLKWMARLDGVYTASTQQELNKHLDSKSLVADNANDLNKIKKQTELTDFIANLISTGAK